MYRLALGLLVTCGCALGPGGPYGTLEPTFEAVVVAPSDRALPDGWQQLNTDYQARFTVVRLDLEALDLLAPRGDAATFDPANPPPGYSLCHGGHCHRSDGALIPYEEVAAELAGGGGAVVVVSLPIGPRDLLAGGREALTCVPGCDLPRANVSLARLSVSRIRLEGFVRDSLPQPRIPGEVPFRLEAALAPVGGEARPGSVINTQLSLPVDRRAPPLIRFDATLPISGALLDRVQWTDISPSSGVLDLSGNDPQALLVLQNLERSPLGATVSRSNP